MDLKIYLELGDQLNLSVSSLFSIESAQSIPLTFASTAPPIHTECRIVVAGMYSGRLTTTGCVVSGRYARMSRKQRCAMPGIVLPPPQMTTFSSTPCPYRATRYCCCRQVGVTTLETCHIRELDITLLQSTTASKACTRMHGSQGSQRVCSAATKTYMNTVPLLQSHTRCP